MTQDAGRQQAFCASCGASLESAPGAAFCPYCGAPQSGNPPHATVQKEQQRRSAMSLLLPALGIALVLGGISFAITRLAIPETQQPAQQQAAAPQAQQEPQPDPAAEARISSLRDSLIANPESAPLTLSFANALYDAGHYERAIEFYERYLIRFDSTDADARVDYAHTLFNLGRREEAVAQTKRALEFRPSHQVALFNLGIMAFQAQDVQNARTWFQRCIDAGPETEMGKRAQQALNSIPSSN